MPVPAFGQVLAERRPDPHSGQGGDPVFTPPEGTPSPIGARVSSVQLFKKKGKKEHDDRGKNPHRNGLCDVQPQPK